VPQLQQAKTHADECVSHSAPRATHAARTHPHGHNPPQLANSCITRLIDRSPVLPPNICTGVSRAKGVRPASISPAALAESTALRATPRPVAGPECAPLLLLLIQRRSGARAAACTRCAACRRSRWLLAAHRLPCTCVTLRRCTGQGGPAGRQGAGGWCFAFILATRTGIRGCCRRWLG
jgi:hypothetical protein